MTVAVNLADRDLKRNSMYLKKLINDLVLKKIKISPEAHELSFKANDYINSGADNSGVNLVSSETLLVCGLAKVCYLKYNEKNVMT